MERIVKKESHLTNFNHAGTLEQVYHSLYNKYCPKRFYFSYKGMIARSQLTRLDFNAGVGLQQAETKFLELRFKQQFSKVTQSWIAKKFISKKGKVYLNHLNEEYLIPAPKNVPKNIAVVEKPDKKYINTIRRRFSV